MTNSANLGCTCPKPVSIFIDLLAKFVRRARGHGKEIVTEADRSVEMIGSGGCPGTREPASGARKNDGARGGNRIRGPRSAQLDTINPEGN